MIYDGSYSGSANVLQALEFVRFKERLAASHARAVAYTENAVHTLTSVPAPSPSSMLEAASAAAQTLQSALLPSTPCDAS